MSGATITRIDAGKIGTSSIATGEIDWRARGDSVCPVNIFRPAGNVDHFNARVPNLLFLVDICRIMEE